MLRHTALFLHRDTITPEQQLVMLKGLAYLRFESAGVKAVDYGVDLDGGGRVRREVKPWLRTPIWRAQQEGPASHYDVALHLDFDDDAGFDAYNHDAAHAEVGAYNASINTGEFTARINYWYDGPPSIERGAVRHCALFLWTPGTADDDKTRATDAVSELAQAPGVRRLIVGHNVPLLRTDYDWILDMHLADTDAATELIASERYREAMAVVVAATQYEWTATITHSMRGL